MMDWISRIYKVQVDITSHCNAKCPGCIRTKNFTEEGYTVGEKRFNDLKLEHFSVDMWKDLCTSDSGFSKFKNFTHLTLNGTWGDPCMHPNLPDMLEIFCENFPNVFVMMHTNGGAQSSEWWNRLGKILASQPHMVIVALDGLEDTHSLYRRGTDFNRILSNVTAFVDGGGSPRWMMTLFDHNVHQIEEAKELAKKYEFRRFQTRKSHTAEMHINTNTEQYSISTNDILSEHIVNEKAAGANNRVPFVPIPDRPELPEVDSQCEWYNDGAIQIDPWGYVLPCCHMAHLPVMHDSKYSADQSDIANFNKHNPNIIENLQLKKSTLHDILSDNWFTDILEKQVESAKLTICQKECGVKNKRG